ncbi:MAG: SLC13 family permease, partial [Pseudorhodoplanes sp.]
MHERSTFATLPAAIALAACVSAIIPGDYSARLTLVVFVATVIAWTMTSFDRTAVALVAALCLVIGGADTPQNFYSSLGNPLIWLLVGAFVIARALTEIRLAERLASTVLKSARSVSGLFYALTLVISATAFVIPSTTGRAALLLPVFLTLAASIGNPQVSRALSVHIPTVILLSAGGSLIGAGANLVAVDMIREIGREPGAAREPMSFLEWMILGLPFALASSLMSTFVILRLFLDREQRTMPVTALERPAPSPLSARESLVLALVGLTVALWLTQSWHGIQITIVTIAAAIAITAASPSGMRLKDALKSGRLESSAVHCRREPDRRGADRQQRRGRFAQCARVVQGCRDASGSRCRFCSADRAARASRDHVADGARDRAHSVAGPSI